MPLKGVSLPALVITGTGALFVWSGIKGASITASLRSLIGGQAPTGTKVNPIATPAAAPGGGGSGPSGTGQAPGTTTAAGRGSGGGGPVLGPAAIKALWLAAGGSPAHANTAVCIAQHESSGQVAVTSSNPDGGTNVGLWQLDTPGGKGAGYSVAQLKNPLLNARVAVKGSSNGTDWSAWATAPMCGV